MKEITVFMKVEHQAKLQKHLNNLVKSKSYKKLSNIDLTKIFDSNEFGISY